MGSRGVWLAALVALLAVPSAAEAQGRKVTGTVVRTVGDVPIPEAIVGVQGGTARTRSLADGKFTIEVPAGPVTLFARAIGYKARQIQVGADQASVTIALEQDVLKLEEMVVTGQTTTLERRAATTAISTVQNDEIVRAPSQSLEQALQGKVVGATISMNSGAPGGAGQIQIRGATSILGNGQPLIIVDGVIFSNDATSSGANTVTRASTGGSPIASNQDAVVNRLADVNPSEIESIEVLKSAAATAIYGSRATNGVVVIRTKRGSAGSPKFGLSAGIGSSQPVRLLGTRTFTNTQDIIDIPNGNGSNSDAVAYLNATFPNGTIPASANLDLQKQFYKLRDPNYNVTANLSGGSEGTQYFASATQKNEGGTAPNTGAMLTALRVNVDQRMGDRFKASAGAGLTRNLLNRGLSGNDNTATSPIYNFAYTPGVIDLTQKDANGRYIRNPFNGGGNQTSNPFETFDFLTMSEEVTRLGGNVNFAFDAVRAQKHIVTLQATGGADNYTQQGILISPSFLQYEGNDGFRGRTANSKVTSLQYNLGLSGTWTYTVNPNDFSFTTVFGGSYEDQAYDLLRTRARNTLPGVDITQQGTQDLVANRTRFRDQAFYLTEQVLAFNERLALTGGFRADRSSANGDVNKWYYFPRAAASYRIDVNRFGFDNVKPRLNWARTGNRPRFGDRDVTFTTGSVIGGSQGVLVPGTLGNPAIKPETLTEIEGGLDATLFRQRLSIEATYFSRKITDLLLNPPTPPSSGISNLVINGGELSVTGWEGAVNAVPVQSRNFAWNTRATFQKNTQKIQDLPTSVPNAPIPGSFGAAFGRNYLARGKSTAIWGNVPLDANLQPLPLGVYVTNPSLVKFRRDTIAGDANPDFQIFLGNTFQYKSLSFSFTFDWRKGGLVANMTHLLYDEGGTSRDYVDPVPAEYLGAGPAPAGSMAGQFRYDAWFGGSDVRMYLESGTYFRLRDIQLSWDAPASAARAIGARSLRLNLQGRNLFLGTNYWAFDPEFNNFGNTNFNRFIDLAPFPGTRQFFFNVDLGF